jgi:lipid-A-disaccharide synthase
VNFEGSQNDPGLKDREEGNIASILPTIDRSNLGRFDGPKNSPNLTGRGIDLFIVAGELSGDLHGAKLIEELLKQNPKLTIGAVAGPKMRKLPIQEFFPMEKLMVMGFIDVLLALPKIARQFFAIRNQILALNPKAVVLIDYPGFNLRLEKSLRAKGYQGKLIHYICPTVWAWGKKRIGTMEKNLDLLLTIFPFEPKCFEKTRLPVQYVGHPLGLAVASFVPKGKFQGKILSIFPGSRKKEIKRNLPLQLKVARRLKEIDPTLQIIISTVFPLPRIPDATLVGSEETYELMSASHLAIATSGTVTLELALHKVPTVVTYAITKMDCFLAQKVFKINLPFYCIANIVLNKEVFPELFGPHFTEENLYLQAKQLLSDSIIRQRCIENCLEVKRMLGTTEAAKEAALAICDLSEIFFTPHGPKNHL